MKQSDDEAKKLADVDYVAHEAASLLIMPDELAWLESDCDRRELDILAAAIDHVMIGAGANVTRELGTYVLITVVSAWCRGYATAQRQHDAPAVPLLDAMLTLARHKPAVSQ